MKKIVILFSLILFGCVFERKEHGPQGFPGEIGEQGPVGEQGPKGEDGKDGEDANVYMVSMPENGLYLQSSTVMQQDVHCLAGDLAVGGMCVSNVVYCNCDQDGCDACDPGPYESYVQTSEMKFDTYQTCVWSNGGYARNVSAVVFCWASLDVSAGGTGGMGGSGGN